MEDKDFTLGTLVLLTVTLNVTQLIQTFQRKLKKVTAITGPNISGYVNLFDTRNNCCSSHHPDKFRHWFASSVILQFS